MPTYEYECQACGFRFERFQRMLDEPVKECPECSGPTKRLIGKGMGVIIKGNSAFSSRSGGKTCCGREERCDRPPCTDDQSCKR